MELVEIERDAQQQSRRFFVALGGLTFATGEEFDDSEAAGSDMPLFVPSVTAHAVGVRRPKVSLEDIQGALERVIQIGHGYVASARTYMRHAAEEHSERCLHHHLGDYASAVFILDEALKHIDRLAENEPQFANFWRRHGREQLAAIAERLDDIVETLALSVDDEFIANLSERAQRAGLTDEPLRIPAKN
jgi:hypothetical protein